MDVFRLSSASDIARRQATSGSSDTFEREESLDRNASLILNRDSQSQRRRCFPGADFGYHRSITPDPLRKESIRHFRVFHVTAQSAHGGGM